MRNDDFTKPRNLAPDIHIPISPPQMAVDAASGIQGLGVESAVVLEVGIGVAAHARSTGRSTGRDCRSTSLRLLASV